MLFECSIILNPVVQHGGCCTWRQSGLCQWVAVLTAIGMSLTAVPVASGIMPPATSIRMVMNDVGTEGDGMVAYVVAKVRSGMVVDGP